VVIGKLLEKGDVNHGFDVQNGSYVDMVSPSFMAGVRRPSLMASTIARIC
jgi:hypothetical protein